jgi:hypothetical protein
MITIETRRMPSTNAPAVVLRVASRSLADTVVAGIPEARRKTAHAIARMGDEHSPFSPMFIYRHLVEAGDLDAAALAAVAFVRESRARNERVHGRAGASSMAAATESCVRRQARAPPRLGDDTLMRAPCGRRSAAQAGAQAQPVRRRIACTHRW